MQHKCIFTRRWEDINSDLPSCRRCARSRQRSRVSQVDPFCNIGRISIICLLFGERSIHASEEWSVRSFVRGNTFRTTLGAKFQSFHPPWVQVGVFGCHLHGPYRWAASKDSSSILGNKVNTLYSLHPFLCWCERVSSLGRGRAEYQQAAASGLQAEFVHVKRGQRSSNGFVPVAKIIEQLFF